MSRFSFSTDWIFAFTVASAPHAPLPCPPSYSSPISSSTCRTIFRDTIGISAGASVDSSAVKSTGVRLLRQTPTVQAARRADAWKGLFTVR